MEGGGDWSMPSSPCSVETATAAQMGKGRVWGEVAKLGGDGWALGA